MRRSLSWLLTPLLATPFGCDPSVQPGPAPGPGKLAVREVPPVDLLEEQERRVAEAVAKARSQVVTLEFTADDTSSAGARRVATGVVVHTDAEGSDVLSVRIASPSSGSPILARDADGRRLPVRWVADDPETGLTLLRIPTPGASSRTPKLPTPPGPPRLGSQVLVIGNPFGLGHSVTRGAVSGLDRRLELGSRTLGGLIQLDAALHPGDSGALIVNLRGEWLGLLRSGLATPGAEPAREHDVGFAIPARDALWVADQLRTRQRVDRAYLGIRIALRTSTEGSGAVLDSVLDDTPADRAGLRSGDRVVALDGLPITSPRDLTDRLDRTLANAETTIDYFRGPHRDRRTLRTASRPQPDRDPAPPRTEDPRTASSKVLLEQIERLERRIAELEQERTREKDASRREQASAATDP